MKLNDIQSKALLPRFANSYAWVQNVFDIIVKKVFGRAKSIDAPMTMESIQALNEAELQALYEQYGIAEYYPDLSRETRDNMLYEMCRIYRYLGTPKAVEILCKYIFDSTPLDVTVLDNLAFDDNGDLVDASLLDTFDIAINPQDAVLDEWAHNRILANIIRFSRNSQALRDIYYDYIEQFDLPVYMAVHSSNNPVVIVDLENDELADAIVQIPLGGTVGIGRFVGNEIKIEYVNMTPIHTPDYQYSKELDVVQPVFGASDLSLVRNPDYQYSKPLDSAMPVYGGTVEPWTPATELTAYFTNQGAAATGDKSLWGNYYLYDSVGNIIPAKRDVTYTIGAKYNKAGEQLPAQPGEYLYYSQYGLMYDSMGNAGNAFRLVYTES